MAQEQDTAISELCDAAAQGEAVPGAPRTIRAAHKDISARGRVREWWFRLAWRGGGWVYLGDRRLSPGTYLADDRHDTVTAQVWPGELIVQHDRGGPTNAVYLVTHTGLQRLNWHRSHGGELAIRLPDGREITRPDPRR